MFKSLRLLPVSVFLLLMVAITAFSAQTLYFMPGGAQKTSTTDYVVPVISNPTTGFLVPATAIFSIPQDVAVKIPALPVGTKQVRVYIHPGKDANMGPSSVASGTTYPCVASGTMSERITVGTLSPSIYFVGRSGDATGTLICE